MTLFDDIRDKLNKLEEEVNKKTEVVKTVASEPVETPKPQHVVKVEPKPVKPIGMCKGRNKKKFDTKCKELKPMAGLTDKERCNRKKQCQWVSNGFGGRRTRRRKRKRTRKKKNKKRRRTKKKRRRRR